MIGLTVPAQSAKISCIPRAVLSSQLSTMATSTSMSSGAARAGIGTQLLTFAREQPYKTNIIIATVKTALCDLVVQKYIERKESIDWQRNGVFAAFGFAYLGCMQWFIYVDCFKWLFPGMATFASQTLRQKLANPAGLRALAGQVALDNFVHYTFVYFPIFYIFKELIQGEQGGGMASLCNNALAKYKVNAMEDNMKMWMLWVPGDIIVYAVPIWMRLPLNHGISFVWTCYLSFLRGGSPQVDDTEQIEPQGSINRGAGKLPWTQSGISFTPPCNEHSE